MWFSWLGKNAAGRGREMLNRHYRSHLFYIADGYQCQWRLQPIYWTSAFPCFTHYAHRLLSMHLPFFIISKYKLYRPWTISICPGRGDAIKKKIKIQKNTLWCGLSQWSVCDSNQNIPISLSSALCSVPFRTITHFIIILSLHTQDTVDHFLK